MAERCQKGDWVEIHNIVLTPQERSRNVPDDTKKVPLEAWIKGWALDEGEIGTEIEIRTPSGRRVKGTLTRVNPAYTHSFGPVVPELSAVGQELRRLLKEGN